MSAAANPGDRRLIQQRSEGTARAQETGIIIFQAVEVSTGLQCRTKDVTSSHLSNETKLRSHRDLVCLDKSNCEIGEIRCSATSYADFLNQFIIPSSNG